MGLVQRHTVFPRQFVGCRTGSSIAYASDVGAQRLWMVFGI